MDKYKIIDDICIEHATKTLYRIQALKAFADVAEGDLGGWVQSYVNLSQLGSSWIYDEAKCYDWSVVSGDAMLRNHAEAFGHSKVFDRATITNHSKVFDRSKAYGHCSMTDHAKLLQHAQLTGGASIIDFGMAQGRSIIRGNACVHNYAKTSGHAIIDEGARVGGDVHVYDSVLASGKAVLEGALKFSGKGTIDQDICVTTYNR
jgi:UDP-3-O-[3-hydroxymyristoyl] glucosamine N-acyltransferase